MTDPFCGSYYHPGPCTAGGDGHLGVGGYGGDDSWWITGPLVFGYAGGGGGGGSSFGPSGTNFGLNYSQPKVEFIS